MFMWATSCVDHIAIAWISNCKRKHISIRLKFVDSHNEWRRGSGWIAVKYIHVLVYSFDSLRSTSTFCCIDGIKTHFLRTNNLHNTHLDILTTDTYVSWVSKFYTHIFYNLTWCRVDVVSMSVRQWQSFAFIVMTVALISIFFLWLTIFMCFAYCVNVSEWCAVQAIKCQIVKMSKIPPFWLPVAVVGTISV